MYKNKACRRLQDEVGQLQLKVAKLQGENDEMEKTMSMFEREIQEIDSLKRRVAKAQKERDEMEQTLSAVLGQAELTTEATGDRTEVHNKKSLNLAGFFQPSSITSKRAPLISHIYLPNT